MASKPMPKQGGDKFDISRWNKKGDFKVVVGIDFGTDGSGVAVGLNDGTERVFVDQEMNENSRFVDIKTKTNILLDASGNFIAFGREATEKYVRQFEDEDDEEQDDEHKNDDDESSRKNNWLYFSQFKMALYKKAIKKQTIATQGGDDELKQDEHYKTDIKKELPAANGKKLPSRTVFIEALKFMKEHAFKTFAKHQIDISDKNQIKWVLTVPAIWSDKSKGLMEQWAVEAGLISRDKKVVNQLIIAYEPDCASISIQNEIKDYKKLLEKKNKKQKPKEEEKESKENEKKKPKQYLTPGEKYLLLDLGGGTADIACHQVIDDFTVKEVYQPSGGAWGSGYIDRHFIRLLGDLLERGWLQEFQMKRPSDYTVLLNNFRRAKETFYVQDMKANKGHMDPSMHDKQKTHNITLPTEFIEFLEDKLEEYNNFKQIQNDVKFESIADYIASRDFLGTTGKWILNEDKLELDYSVWTHMFDEVIDQIIDHCRNLLRMEPLKDKQCRYICLVGGFSSSRYLQSRIMYELGIKSEYRLIVIVPKRPSLSVVDGAVRLGLKPDYIKSRVVQKTYGIKVNAPVARFKLKELDSSLVEKNRYFNKRANQEYLHNIFHAYVRRGDEIDITDEPKSTKFYASKRNIVGIEVFDSEETNPTFITGKAIAKKDVILPANWDIHTTFPISFFFGDTKIRVFADIEGIKDSEKEIHLEYEF
eukprot:CAMPEP_0197026112 /NCGR_PEP_ID=MMETSP1384-20130603/6279_1 /TAXON_ID=29189 /ORGANISM="Ammonia sp." /LENGTH=703 /DNA_ID=CAMNT_0042454723 /DNA_START=41 /DNA_END=2152 /DNA_ORIENTATION=+